MLLELQLVTQACALEPVLIHEAEDNYFEVDRIWVI